jgi:flavin reductase (DIM6/NTAB) family NADH-FMN oxidoreductase RutF
MSFTTTEFRRAMALFATGFTIVTTTLDDTFYGLTVNSFCSVSLNPTLVLISIDKSTRSYPILLQSQVFGVNILTEQQRYLSERFARKDASERRSFDDILLHTGETGVPLFDDALAYLECRVVNVYEGGDHMLFLGEVIKLHENAAPEMSEQGVSPLVFYRSRYCSTRPEVCLSKSE